MIKIFSDIEDRYLQPPALTKQFLISPPASPPVGWEPQEEGGPLVNHDLLAAIANLSPGILNENTYCIINKNISVLMNRNLLILQ